MPRYFVRPRASGWAGDDLFDDDRGGMRPDITVADHVSIDTGLIDSDGNAIMRAPNPMGAPAIRSGDMALPLIPLLGPLLIKGLAKSLPARFAETWAPRIGKIVALAIVAGALCLAIDAAIGAIREDAREDLLTEQAAARAKADAAQREREREAEQARRDELKAGAALDAAGQKELTDATKDLPDARPSDRARLRICVELRQQARRKAEPEPDC